MAKSRTSNSNKRSNGFQPPRDRPRWMIAVLCLLLGLWLTVAYLDYNPLQEGYMTTDSTGPADKNLVGKIGADVARISFVALGLGAWMVPLFSFWSLWIAVRHSRRLAFGRFTAMTLAIVSACGLAAMIKMDSFAESQFFPDGRLGGVLGFWVYDRLLFDTVGVFGSASLLATIDVVALVIIFTRDIAAQCEKLITSFHDWRAHRRERRAERAEEKRAAKAIAAKLREEEKAAIKAAKLAEKERIAEEKAAKKEAAKAGAAVATKEIKLAGGTEDPLAKAPAKRPAPAPTPEPEPEPAPEPRPKPKVIGLSLGKPNDGSETSPPSGGTSSPLKIVKAEELKKARNADAPKKVGSYEYPPKSLLTEQAKPHEDNSEEEHQRNADNLLRILEEFGVKVSLGEIHVGPVITRYEVIPAPGVRVEKISGLDKNIALGMRAQSVRILAPIPGKAAVGVEVPNQHPTAVGMREILESQDWVSTKAELPIALGKDVSGKPLVSDLAKMPHLLIAGATGSGKSVCINSIVASIVYSKTPDEVRMIMVDPKVVELKVFNTLPHMLIPVVTSPKMVPGALKWLLAEMEQRYQFFAKCNVRNIIGFNNRKKKNVAPDLPDAPPDQADLPGVTPDDEVELPEKLPYIVAIIDELADLMMVAPAEIETSIARLAQLARAAGIHLIIATQRPSVNVITGVIKANLPSRIAFQVASQIDSRTILDTKGADNLIGRGDMLFSPPGTARLVRSQGAFCSDEEVMNIVEFMQAHNGLPIYKQDVQEKIESSEDSKGGGGDDDDGPSDEDDELYNRALGVLKSTKRASTSMIQRRLRIGYNRAARIMDMLEDRDIVGPENGSSPREILVDLDSL